MDPDILQLHCFVVSSFVLSTNNVRRYKQCRSLRYIRKFWNFHCETTIPVDAPLGWGNVSIHSGDSIRLMAQTQKQAKLPFLYKVLCKFRLAQILSLHNKGKLTFCKNLHARVVRFFWPISYMISAWKKKWKKSAYKIYDSLYGKSVHFFVRLY